MSKKNGVCPRCDLFVGETNHASGYCRKCCSELSTAQQKRWRTTRPFYRKLIQKKTESKSKGIEFNLTEDYLKSIWTGICPILDYKLVLYGDKSRWVKESAQLDRIDPTKGYTIGNVVWLSAEANRLKDNLNLEKIEKLYRWMKSC